MIPKFSVKKPFTIAVGVVITLILGFVSFSKMTTDLLPSVDLPYVMVNVPYPGANPEKVESNVTKLLEQVLATTSGLKNISSTSSENSSVIMLEFNEDVNMDSTMLEINSKIDMIEGSFDDKVGSPILMKLNPDMMPIMVLSIDIKDKDIKEVTKYVNDEIVPKFERIDGVASITVDGLVRDELRISLDLDKIDSLNKKVLNNINSEFLGEEETLNDAKNEIKNSKNKITNELNTQISTIDKALTEVKSGISSLRNIVDNVSLSDEEIQKNVNEINTNVIKISMQIDELNLKLVNSTDELEKNNLLTQIKTLEETKKKLEESIKSLNDVVKAKESLSELKAKESELIKTKSTLELELKNAITELDKGEEEISQGEDKLEEAKEKALGSSDMQEKITPEIIGNILLAQNFSMPAGYINEGEKSYSVKVGEEFGSEKEVEELVLFDIEGVGEVKLKDVADVSIKDDSDENYSNINGNQGVVLTFQKSSNISTSEVTKLIKETIEKIKKEDKNINITTLMDQGVYIDMIVNNVLSNLIYGGVLAVVVLLVFLRSFKTTLVVAFSIPISVLFAIVMMYFSGVTLNIISLSGLALGVGMLVDNSIVVIENIYRLRNEGYSIKKAAVYGTRQVSTAIFASTLTTICVFLPIVFTDGITKQLFMDMALTIAYSLIASLIVALTVVPAMSSSLSIRVNEGSNLFDKIVDIYEVILTKSLKNKFVVIIFTLSLFIFSIYKGLNMGTSFMPEMDSIQMMASITLDEESKREDLINKSDEFVKRVRTIEDIQTVGAVEGLVMGPSNGETTDLKSMTFYIILDEDKKLSNDEISDMIKEKTKDMNVELEISTSNMDMGSLVGEGILIEVKGLKLEKLKEISNDISKILADVEGTYDINGGFENSNTEYKIIVDKNKAMEYNLTVASVYNEVAKLLETENSKSTFTFESNEYPVIVEKENDIKIENILENTIKGTKNNEEVDVKLSDITSLEKVEVLQDINRTNQSRYINITCSIKKGYNIGLVGREVEEKLKDYDVPSGYSVELKGENETINKTLFDLVLMGVLAITFVYLIMVAQFQSLISPFIVMFTIPLAFTGGLLALLITKQDISVISMLGFLVLSGVVVNNGIVFVDYINQLRLEGLTKKEAIILTGRTRIRPILMTALTTILAMSTMAVGVGMGAEMSQGLAIVTIGGLIYSTLLTLILIPVLYDLIHRKNIIEKIDEDF